MRWGIGIPLPIRRGRDESDLMTPIPLKRDGDGNGRGPLTSHPSRSANSPPREWGGRPTARSGTRRHRRPDSGANSGSAGARWGRDHDPALIAISLEGERSIMISLSSRSRLKESARLRSRALIALPHDGERDHDLAPIALPRSRCWPDRPKDPSLADAADEI